MAKESLTNIIVPDNAYDPTLWDGNREVPTKNAIRDKIEALGGGITEDDLIAMSVAL